MTIPTAMLCAIEPGKIAAWLCENRWTLSDTWHGHTAVYPKPAGEEGDLVVDFPLNPMFRDQGRRLREILQTLEIASGKPASQMLAELSSSTRDNVRRLSLTGAVAQPEGSNPARGGAVECGQLAGYIDREGGETDDRTTEEGRRITVDSSEVDGSAAGVRTWAEAMTTHLEKKA